MRDAMAAAQVLGPDVGGKAVAGVVGEPNGFVVAFERRHADDGAEDLFLEDAHVGTYIGEHGRGQVVARSARWSGRLPPVTSRAPSSMPLSMYDMTRS